MTPCDLWQFKVDFADDENFSHLGQISFVLENRVLTEEDKRRCHLQFVSSLLNLSDTESTIKQMKKNLNLVPAKQTKMRLEQQRGEYNKYLSGKVTDF